MNGDHATPNVLGYFQTLFFILGVLASVCVVAWAASEGLTRLWGLAKRRKHKVQKESCRKPRPHNAAGRYGRAIDEGANEEL